MCFINYFEILHRKMLKLDLVNSYVLLLYTIAFTKWLWRLRVRPKEGAVYIKQRLSGTYLLHFHSSEGFIILQNGPCSNNIVTDVCPDKKPMGCTPQNKVP